MKIKIPQCALLVAVLALFAGSIPALAQDEWGLMNVRIVTVKQDHVGDWVELQKEQAEAMKKAGAPGRIVWEVVKGDHNTFHILTPLDGWADYDNNNGPFRSDTEQANWINDIVETIQSRQELTVWTFDNLNIPPAEGSKPNLVALWQHTVKQENKGDMYDWFEEKMVPALKKVGAKGRSFGRIIIGGNVNTFYHARRLDSYADMGGWTFRSLNAEERADLLSDERQSWIVNSEQILLQYREDLSYSSED
jgi:hypothetical protein